jgi:hypothetical protein
MPPGFSTITLPTTVREKSDKEDASKSSKRPTGGKRSPPPGFDAPSPNDTGPRPEINYETQIIDGRAVRVLTPTATFGYNSTMAERDRLYQEILKDRKRFEDELKKDLLQSLSVKEYSVFDADETVVRASYESDIEEFTTDSPNNFLYVSEYRAGEIYGALLCWRHLIKESSRQENKNNDSHVITSIDGTSQITNISSPPSVATVNTKTEATHYEIYRKNHVALNSGYEKIGQFTYRQLIEERDRGAGQGLLPYVREVLKIDNASDSSLLYFLDTNIKMDSIYSYRIVSVKVCENERVDYLYALRSAGFLDYMTLQQFQSSPSINRLLLWGVRLYGDQRFRWVISLVNKNLDYFGNRAGRLIDRTTANIASQYVNFINNARYLDKMIKESISKFGAYKTYIHLFEELGGLNQTLFNILQSTGNDAIIVDGSNSFNFTRFKERVANEYAIFDLTLKALNVADSQRVVEQVFGGGVDFPPQEGYVNIADIGGATQVFDFVERIFHLLTVAEGQSEQVSAGLQRIIVEDEEVQDIISQSSAEYIEQAHTDALNTLGVDGDSIVSLFNLSTTDDDDISVE